MVKKNRTCNNCGKQFSSPRKLRDHQNKKFPCRPRISQTEKNEWQDPNARQLGETIKQWGARLRKKYL